MKHSFVRWLLASVGVGLIVSVSLFLIETIVNNYGPLEESLGYPLNRITQVIWPTSFWLLATDGIEGTPRAYLFLLMSVAANGVLYGVLGSVVWAIKHMTRERAG
jgi:hypothetical protein